MFNLGQDHLPARHGVAGAGHHIRNTPGTRRSRRRAIRGVVLLVGLLGCVAALAGSGVPASAATAEAVTAGQVSAISSVYDPAAGGLHVFSVTPSGVYETYWSNTNGTKHTDK